MTFVTVKGNVNIFQQSINKKIADAVKALSEPVPEILEEEKQWEALIKVAEIHFASPDTDKLALHARYWILIKGQRVMWDNCQKLEKEQLSFSFYASVVDLSDWELTRYLLLKMPSPYVEKYLIEELPKMGEIQQLDYFKTFSKRTDEWGQYPAKWIKKAYGAREHG